MGDSEIANAGHPVRFEWSTINAQTGRSWQQWYDLLNAAGGRSMSHRALSRYLETNGYVSGWWCQAIVTNYERAVGAREIGQTCTGVWAASARITTAEGLDQTIQRWAALADGEGTLPAPLATAPTRSGSEKFRYWRARLADGTRLDGTASIPRSGARTVLSVTHSRLAGAAAVSAMRAYWKARLRGL